MKEYQDICAPNMAGDWALLPAQHRVCKSLTFGRAAKEYNKEH